MVAQGSSSFPQEPGRLLAAVVAMARPAGAVVLRHYADPACTVRPKSDGTPLTAADCGGAGAGRLGG
jgi:3'-phosphoadenosine 5'-phosphosulfate (PAPS) 3'-phosphatase